MKKAPELFLPKPFWDLLCPVCFRCVPGIHIERDDIKPGNTHQSVNDSGKPRHVTEHKCYKVKAEKSDQSPVESTNDGNRQGKTV